MKSYLPNWKFVHNISGNRVGRIIVAWDDSCCSVSVVGAMEQHMLCKVEMMGFLVFYLSVVYGAYLYVDRRLLWKNLIDSTVVDAPWVVAGDFNITRDAEQVKGGKLPEAIVVEEFNGCLDELDVTEQDGHGKVFTWCSNWRTREGQLRKLDHVFCNSEWMQSFSQSYVHIQPPDVSVSDHCLLSVHLKSNLVNG
ncbi:hypothetical protein LIER_29091 [Lithospermum erythrorhizon]|uniref:Endonuclease/exonuclease/phosphatase domain-containing protein n=1 Tax=Lithospermum erythrorhizon TaxID=34254 RepID=A0AAV3RI09_LITER